MIARLATNPRRLVIICAVVLSLAWFAVYLTTVSPTVNFIDSGELVTAAHEPGIAHPPGYPLYILMGYVVTHLLWGDVAWRMNVLSAFWGAMAVGALFLLIYDASGYLLDLPRARARKQAPQSRQQRQSPPAVSRKATPKVQKGTMRAAPREQSVEPAEQTIDATSRVWLLIATAAAGASLLGASASFWSRTAQAKMYTLHFFIVFVLFILALECRKALDRNDRPAVRRWFVALAFTLGLGLANHQMTLLTVLPLAIVLLAGTGTASRTQALMRSWALAVPAFIAPLLLYLYMPIRSAQGPIMNWGSPDNAGDFYRQITDWQFRPYLLGNLAGNFQQNVGRIWDYATAQWALLTILVFAAGIVGAVLLFRASRVLFAGIVSYALITLLFCLAYGISELEPYIVPFYAMFVLWVGLAPAAYLVLTANRARQVPSAAPARTPGSTVSNTWTAVAIMALVALGSAILVYPKENFSNNRLAEQFVNNVFAQLPQNSILITDYWDFYAPTYYEQLIKNERPDLTLIDKSLLRYPFFTQQLKQRFPWLIAKSQDIVATFSAEQRKWVNGEQFDAQVLNTSYFDLMTSFLERNQPDHPAFLLTLDSCVPNVVQSCESNQIAPTWTRQSYGLVTRLLPAKPAANVLPPLPDYKLDGILTNPVSFDDAARVNTQLYVNAYQQLAVEYGIANQPDKAQQLNQMASAIAANLASR